MFSIYDQSGGDLLERMAARATSPAKGILDDASYQRIATHAADHFNREIALCGATTVQAWAELQPEDMGKDDSRADMLIGMLCGVADADADKLDAAGEDVATIAANAAWDYMVEKGASEDDLAALFGDDEDAAEEAAERIQELLADELPDEEEAMDDAMVFAFADAGVLDAVYKKKLVVRGGKKMRILKRISGMVRRTAAQKMAIRKARMKSHSAAAMLHRAKSVRVRKASGLK